jgi:pimeloyl-ACP methyl ester carboxylesterase
LRAAAKNITIVHGAFADGSGWEAVLVGHSYGGAVITQAGDDPKVKSLVYVAAYVPGEGEGKGESVGDLLAQKDPDAHIVKLIYDK